MNKKELIELLKFSSPSQLYIITWNNLLKLLICPFKVLVKVDIGLLRANEVVWVDEVKVTLDLKTIFIIENKAYYYYHFEILDQDVE
ncbi:hypothetical protein [Mesonia mobilis]|nr:hypothetical protein [Mesonia mobilis]MBQ0739105.1 hypothetical protein [Aquimarina celericrescens]